MIEGVKDWQALAVQVRAFHPGHPEIIIIIQGAVIMRRLLLPHLQTIINHHRQVRGLALHHPPKGASCTPVIYIMVVLYLLYRSSDKQTTITCLTTPAVRPVRPCTIFSLSLVSCNLTFTNVSSPFLL